MDGENGRQLTTNTNVANEGGEKNRSPFSLVNSETSYNNKTEQEESARNSKSHVPNEASFVDSPESTKHSSVVSFRPTDSPSIQVMERIDSPDPENSSTRSDDSPGSWSVDSNDSLFSIGMENDSFSKDIALSGEMCSAGELSLSDAYLPQVSHRSGELYQSGELDKSPAAKGRDEEVKDDNKVTDKPNSDMQRDSNLSSSTDPNASHHSDDSKARNEDFASALTTGNACPLCECLWCGKICCCRWPSCKLFGWPSCCSNNCLSLPSCCNKCYCSNLFYGSCYSWKHETKRTRSHSAHS